MGARVPAASADDDARVFEVFVNGRATQLQAEFVQHGRKLSATADDLRAIGVLTDGVRPDGSGRIALDEIPGLTWTLDERRQEVHLKAADAALIPTQLAPARAPSAAVGMRPDFGVVANYDLLGTQAGGRSAVSGLLDGRFSTPWGVAGSTWLAQSGLPSKPLARLDTALSYVDPAAMRQWRAGDAISGGLAWTRPFRMGGFQLASDFASRPDLVTFPVPVIGGRADVPSTVDLFVNSVRQLSQGVDAGPFQVRQPPVMTGAGDVAVVVRDVTGRERVQSLNFYVSPSLLAPGLVSYSVEGGWLREGYVSTRDRYTQAVASGSGRYGVTDWLTAEAHTEASGRVAMGGIGATANLWNLAIGTVALAGSNPAPAGAGAARRSMGRTLGGQVSIGIERAGRSWSIAASTTRATRAFQDVAATRQNRVPTEVTRVSGGLVLGRWGALRASYAGVSGRAALPDMGIGGYALSVRRDARIVSVGYTHPITDTMQFYANAYRDLAGGGGGARGGATGVGVGLTMLLNARTAATVEGGMIAGSASGALEASQAAIDPGEIGWRARVSRDPADRQNGQVSYVAPFALLSAEFDRVGGRTGLRAGASGSLVGTPRGAFASRRIEDSYAVVDANGIADVSVLHENRPVGRTDADGLLLIPNLRSWQDNKLTLDPVDLPADVAPGKMSRTVRLPARSGGTVRFDMSRSSIATVRLVDGAGKPIPAGSVAQVAGGEETPVGHDGELFLTDLRDRNRVAVRTVRGRCIAEFASVRAAGTLPVIGPVACKPVEVP